MGLVSKFMWGIVVHFDKIYSEYPVSLNFDILSLFLMNGPEALYINPGCFKWISGINFFFC